MKLELNGKNIEIDLLDFDTFENFGKAIQPLQKNFELPITSTSQLIKNYCKTTYDFFDTLLGEGTAEFIFDGKNNMRVCNDCLQKCFIACNDYITKHFEADVRQIFDSWKGLI